MTAPPPWALVLAGAAALFGAFSIGAVVAEWSVPRLVRALHTYRRLARRYERDLNRAERRVDWLRIQVTEAVRIIEALTQAHLDAAARADAEQWVPVPPDVWRKLQEARERPEAN